jgi:hypothetical protein
MKEARTEKLVEELRATVERLNRLDKLLQQSGVSYDLGRNRRDEVYTLENVIQRVEY